MWTYLTFVPCALALIALVALVTKSTSAGSTRSPWRVAAALWLLSWLATVVILYGRSQGSLLHHFIGQREAGYWLGSAVMLALPFFAVAGVGKFLLSAPAAAPQTTRVTLGAVALVGWLLTPGLFGVGWVTGCVILGYQACM